MKVSGGRIQMTNAEAFNYISSFVQRLEIHTRQLPGAGQAEVAPSVAGSVPSLQVRSLQTLLVSRSFSKISERRI